MKKLSYSAHNKFTTCPRMFELHYREGLRPVRTTSALVFGSAMDAGLNALMLGSPKYLSEFENVISRIHMGDIDFDPRDYDGEIISEFEKSASLKAIQNMGYVGDCLDGLMAHLFKKIKDGQALSINQERALNIGVHTSLTEKAKLMFQAYKEQVLPVIKVVEVQVANERGVIDFVAEYNGVQVIGDNKTSSRPFDKDAVRTSVQLAAYGAKHAMYVVMSKQIKKNRVKTCSKCGAITYGREKTCAVMSPDRCKGEFTETVRPEVVLQLLFDEIPEETRQQVTADFKRVDEAAENGPYPQNLAACDKQFGKPCVYFNFCKFGSTEGLIKKEIK